MSDFFGIGQALHAVAQVYFLSARRTGRTTTLLESLKDGDRVIVITVQEQRRLQRELRDRKLTVEVCVNDPARLDLLFNYGTPKGRTIFDHTWVEQFYIRAQYDAANLLDRMHRDLSGHGFSHIETARKFHDNRWSEVP